MRRFIDNIADRELQLLYAVQTLVTQRQHPTGTGFVESLSKCLSYHFFNFLGMIQGIFDILYDSNVVSYEGFELWTCNDDPLEREGKAVLLILTVIKRPILDFLM